MTDNDQRGSMFANVPDSAESTDLICPDDEDALSDLDYDPGECRRIDGIPRGRCYHLRVGDLLLVIEQNRIRRRSPGAMHYDESYGSATRVDPGEAFAFLHGDYKQEQTYKCMGCGTVHTSEKACGCPVGSETFRTQWPDIPPRSPRTVASGELLTHP
jgi:hypothetical protein